MSSEYTRDVLRVVVAKICQTIGWHSIQSTPLEVMVDILRRYLLEITKLTSNYAIQFGHTQPNLDELGLALRDMHVNITDLEEYVRYVDSTPALEIPKYPIKKDSHLNFLKPGSNEVVTRPVHIYEHLPPMLPEVEESEDVKPQLKEEEPSQNADSNVPIFKRPADISPNEMASKRPRLVMEEEGRPTREISSVMMTTSGFLSPAREGKLPEARTPINTIDTPSSTMPQGNSSFSDRFERKGPKVLKEFKNNNKDKRKDKASKELFKPMMDDIGPKKITTMKDVVRLKAMKANIANNSNNNINLPPDVPVKAPGMKINPAAKQNKAQPKTIKTEKPFAPVLTPPPAKVPAAPDKFVEGKLSSEPDKSKLNIFKKIGKVKDDKIEKVEKVKVKEEPRTDGISQESRESSPDLIIDETENKNWEQKLASIKQEIPIKQEPIEKPVKVTPPADIGSKMYDIKSPHSEKDFLYDDDLSPPGTPSTPKTPEMPTHSPPLKVDKELKRKRKDKTKIKNKTKVPKYSLSPRRNKNDSFDGELDRPKTPNDPINLVKEEPVTVPPQTSVQPPVFPFFPGYMSGPGLIPNPLFQRLPLAAGIPKHGFGQPAHIPPTMPALPFVPPIKPPPADEIQEKPPTPAAPDQVIKAEKPDPAIPKEKHKKDKKDKPKKKNKKDKIKNKSEKRKLKEEKKEKDKDKIKKEKREKKKEKEREHEGSVPKLTLKIGSPRPPTPDVQVARKIMIKPVIKKEEEPVSSSVSNVEAQDKREPSPELARISALITRPPKLKTSTATVNDISPRHSSNPNESLTVPPTSIHKLKKSMFRAIPKVKSRDFKRVGDPEDDVSELHTQSDMQMYTQPYVPVPAPVAPAAFYLESHGSKEESGTQQTSTSPKQSGPLPGRSRINTNASKGPSATNSTPIAGVKAGPGKQKPVIVKQQPSSVVDNDGNKVWICPGCGGQDDGSPMIGCDDCDAWYHWVCVGIQVPPDDNEDWYCRICIVKKQETLQMDKKKKRKKKERKEH